MRWEQIIKIKTFGDYPRDIELPDSFFEEKARKILWKMVYDIGYEPSYNYTGKGNKTSGQWAGHRVVKDERVVKVMEELQPLLEKLIRTAIEVKHEGSPNLREELD